MAKREAEKQLTQDNVDDDDRQEEAGSGEFRKATDQALSGRKIRGLPKRRGGGAPGAAPAVAPAGAAPKPSPFGGVASPNPFVALSGSAPVSTASTPFDFGASAAQPASNGAAPSFSFGSTTSTFSAPASSSSTPSFGASATSSFTFGAQSKPAAPAPAQSDKVKYYTSLRALNVSLLDALSSRIENDPFIDLSADGVLDKLKQRYEEHRSRVDKEHGLEREDKMAVEPSSSSSTAAVPPPASFEIPEIFRNPPKPVPIADLTDTSGASDAALPSPAPQKPTVAADDIPDIFKNPPKPVPIADLSEEPAENKNAPPAPPAVFAFAGSAVKSTPTSSPTSTPPAGFVFKPDSAPKVEKSSFTFPAAGSSSSSTPSTSAPSTSAAPAAKSSSRDELKPPSAPKLAPAKLTNPPSKPSPLRFGESVSPPTTPEKGATAGEETQKPKTGFSFGAQFGKIAKGEKEGEVKMDGGEKKKESAKGDEEKKEAPKPALSFGSSTSSSSPFSFGSATPASSAPASTAFSFGSAVTPSSSTETPSKPTLTFGGPTPFSTPASTSLFSAKPASSPPIASSFGSSSPPSFGFGAALQPKDKDQPAPFTAGRNTGFAFGANIGSSSSTGFSFGSAAPASEDKNQAAKATTGFSFAATAPASTSTDSTSAPAASSTPFSFTASTAPPAASASTAPSTAGETDSRAQTPGANPFTAPGEGEEGEDVLHSARGKVWRIEGGQAKEMGIANVSIKERQDNGKVRLLARNETNGAVLINFSLYSTLSLKKEKVFVTFLGFGPDAKPVTYRLRFKDVAMVEEFVDAVEEAKKKLPAA
ncbi:ranBP1 domain containing protein [Rhodotorula toruloides]|uniref:RanBP1 domain containing protein n=1 Tax=Rhodotorula toruloides TaxID=5286 RepID=A0A511KJN3_RHOTO|nr:ranBP1 domain containing protein [Rhodotorula toruloides]